MPNDVYNNPKYYEIAFSWRDIPAEVDLFEQCFRQFSKIDVKSTLEIACGNCPHAAELIKRGYEYSGFDLNPEMLEYSRRKLKEKNLEAILLQRNIVDFSLDFQVDFAFILLGSLFAGSTADLLSHFASVAAALKPGGLYFLDWCVQFEPPFQTQGSSSWDMERDGIKVKTTVSWEPINLARQTFMETMRLEVDDHGRKFDIVEKDVHRAIYPQEFLRLIESFEDFEFIGWWNNWNLDHPLDNAVKIDRPIIIIRRL